MLEVGEGGRDCAVEVLVGRDVEADDVACRLVA